MTTWSRWDRSWPRAATRRSSSADIPASGFELAAANLGKRVFLRWFLRAAGRDEALRALPAAVDGRLADPNWSDAERERLRARGEWASQQTSS